jgi:hypothetical protein
VRFLSCEIAPAKTKGHPKNTVRKRPWKNESKYGENRSRKRE